MNENPYAAPVANPVAPINHLKVPPKRIREVLFSYEGRIPRRAFWGYMIMLTIFNFLLIQAAASFVPKESRTFLVIYFAVQLPVLCMTLAIYAKRWHDRNKSAWWNLIMIALSIWGGWLHLTNETAVMSPEKVMLPSVFVPIIIMGLLGIWLLVECGCLRGTVGPNQYGDDPT